MSKLEKHFVTMKPAHDWMTHPLAIAAEDNPIMSETMEAGSTQLPGSGSTVISGLSELYAQIGRRVLMFDCSSALARVTKRIAGSSDPDDVFTVDYITGYPLKNSAHLSELPGTLINPNPDNPSVNIANQLTATPRMLEHFVARRILEELGVENILVQDPNYKFEGGDFTYLPHEDALITGKGSHSRSNDLGRAWLQQVFQPSSTLSVETDQFHRDLVTVFMLGLQGQVAGVLAALDAIKNRAELCLFLEQKGIKVTNISASRISSCALNLSVSDGMVIGMQSFGDYYRTFHGELPSGVQYHVLPEELQAATRGFVDLQGGANCVSGFFMADPSKIDASLGRIIEINKILHSKDFEEELEAHATALHLKERIKTLKKEQHQSTAA